MNSEGEMKGEDLVQETLFFENKAKTCPSYEFGHLAIKTAYLDFPGCNQTKKKIMIKVDIASDHKLFREGI